MHQERQSFCFAEAKSKVSKASIETNGIGRKPYTCHLLAGKPMKGTKEICHQDSIFCVVIFICGRAESLL